MLYIKTELGWKPLLATYRVCDNHNQLQGVFKAKSLEDTRVELLPRIGRFCAMMKEGQAHHFNEPIVGAFGEKL